jgi:hypothetical protein
MTNKWKRNSQFRMPMTATFSIHNRQDGKSVAHALDFDLVAVGDTTEHAIEKLRTSVKIYIEYGLNNNWAEDIIFPAPDEFWERLSTESPVSIMPPIMIEDNRLFVFQAMTADASNRTAQTA